MAWTSQATPQSIIAFFFFLSDFHLQSLVNLLIKRCGAFIKVYLFYRVVIKHSTKILSKDNSYSAVLFQEISYERSFCNFSTSQFKLNTLNRVQLQSHYMTTKLWVHGRNLSLPEIGAEAPAVFFNKTIQVHVYRKGETLKLRRKMCLPRIYVEIWS